MKNLSIQNWFDSKIELKAEMLNLNYSRIFFCTVFLTAFFIVSKVEAQRSQTLESFLAEEDDSEHLQKLIFDHVPTIMIKNNEVLLMDEGYPQKVICDAASIKTLTIENKGFRTVKLLQIDLSTANQKSGVRLSPETLMHFPNLSHILISSIVPLSPQEVDQMLSGYQDGDIILLYQIINDF